MVVNPPRSVVEGAVTKTILHGPLMGVKGGSLLFWALQTRQTSHVF